MQLGENTPILLFFDEVKAREFYLGFLGFAVVFEHRFEPGMPLYMGVQRDGCVLHWSEHHGDANPDDGMSIDPFGNRLNFTRAISV